MSLLVAIEASLLAIVGANLVWRLFRNRPVALFVVIAALIFAVCVTR